MKENGTHSVGILAKEKEKILACVHCGLCLESCPTYLATGNENDSPRGRIYLMRAVDEGRLEPDAPAFQNHIDRCLGCRACELVCPAGVEYGNLLESARFAIQEAAPKRGLIDVVQSMLLRHVWLFPKRLAVLFLIARIIRATKLPALLLKIGFNRLFPRAAFGLALLDSSSPIRFELTKKVPDYSHLRSRKSNADRNALLFKGCVGEGLFDRINTATVKVLEANAFTLKIPADQNCCGALHAHSGDNNGARQLARRNIDAFGNDESLIVTNAGGCGAMLCQYDHLLADDPEYASKARTFSNRVRDVSQLVPGPLIDGDLQGLEPVTYDTSCHLNFGQRAGDDSLAMLLSTGVDYVALKDSEVCCGGAGIYNLLQPELSSKILCEKLENIKNTGAQVLATGNPGCQMQIRAGMRLFEGRDLKVCHPIEILDEAYRRSGVYEQSVTDGLNE